MPINIQKPRRFIQAAYKPLQDETVLTPEVIQADDNMAEPTPEHKVVVELSGQWSSNSASLYLEKTDTQPQAKLTKPRKDIDAQHRSLAVFKNVEPEPKNLYLALPLNGRPDPLKLLLAESIEPVEGDTEMEEWDNVLVPVVPMYFSTEDECKEKAKLYSSGYLYIIWNNKIWRELLIDNKGYFCDVDIEYYRNQQPLSAKKLRHIDISLKNEEIGCFYSLEPFDLLQNGKVVFSGILDSYGQARVFSLTEETVEVVLTDTSDKVTFELQTELSPFKAAKKVLREAEGKPMPHIWLPYKVLGEEQTELYAFYSAQQLSLTALSNLERIPEEQGIKIDGLANYSSAQEFQESGSSVSTLVMPQVEPDEQQRYALVSSQESCNVAGLFANSPKDCIRLKYSVVTHIDQPDDYFELSDVDGTWSQKAFIRESEFIDNNTREVCFSGWLPEVKRVHLTRVSKGTELHEAQDSYFIYKDIEISELL